MSYTSTIKYKGNVIATLQENEDVELDCAGTVMDGDIEVSVENPIPSFNEADWNFIKSAATSGAASSYWSVGDRKAVILNGTVGIKTFSNTTTYCYILGFDHNKSVESNNAHALHIGFGASALSGGAYIVYCDNNYPNQATTSCFNMNTTSRSTGGWNSCQMKSTICPAFKAALPSDLQSNIRAVTKYQNNGKSTTEQSSSNEIWLLSEMEIFGSAPKSNYTANQAQYDFYKDVANGGYGAAKIRYKDTTTSTAAVWAERSAYSGSTDGFCGVNVGGTADYYNVNVSTGFAPCLCL